MFKHLKKTFLVASVLLLALNLNSCSSTTVPEGIEPVTGIDVNRYLGTWYEIARLDNFFERDLSNITATYSLRKDGHVRVINRGYNIKKKAWKDAEGVAKFVGPKTEGRLKVSFFGPFYGGYNIIDLDKEDYQYVMITGNDRSYFWILSRKPTLDPKVKNKLISKAVDLKFPIEKLIYVDHTPPTTK